MKTERLSRASALMHAYKDITIHGEAVARGFCGKKNGMLNFEFPIKLDHDLLEILSSAVSPVVLYNSLQHQIRSRLVAENSWRADVLKQSILPYILATHPEL